MAARQGEDDPRYGDVGRAMTWYWISLPYATFGIAAQYGRVWNAPPIAMWAANKQIGGVLEYYRRRGATIVRLD